jgi:general secretion pathway protein I
VYAFLIEHPSALSRQRGFSLLEILVAFAVLSISLGIIFQIYSTGLMGVSRSELSSKAAIIAVSQMARIGHEFEIKEGAYSGEEVEGFRWLIDISAYELPDTVLSGVELYKVTVKVVNPEHESFAYEVSTLKANEQ